MLAIIAKNEVLLVSSGQLEYLVPNQVLDDALGIDEDKAVIRYPRATVDCLVELLCESEGFLYAIFICVCLGSLDSHLSESLVYYLRVVSQEVE